MCKCAPIQVKTAGTESRENVHTKRSQTPPYTQERSKAQYTEPKDTVIAKGTDKLIGTGTGNGMAQGALKGHSHTVTREQQKRRLNGGNIAKRYREMAQKRGWAHKIDTGATKYRNCSN